MMERGQACRPLGPLPPGLAPSQDCDETVIQGLAALPGGHQGAVDLGVLNWTKAQNHITTLRGPWMPNTLWVLWLRQVWA